MRGGYDAAKAAASTLSDERLREMMLRHTPVGEKREMMARTIDKLNREERVYYWSLQCWIFQCGVQQGTEILANKLGIKPDGTRYN